MQTKVETVSSIKKKISVDIPAERVAQALERAFQKIQKDAAIKGFRKGHVPRQMLEQYYGREAEIETVDDLIKTTYHEAVEKEAVFPVSKPEVLPGPFQKDGPFSYTATFEVKPEVAVEGYHDLSLEKTEREVSDKAIEARMVQLQNSMTQLEPAPEDAEVKKGFVAFIDFKGTADGSAFKGGEANNFYVDVGAGQMMPEFEEKIIGMKKNEKRSIEFDYPKDYFNKELAGKHGKFDVVVREIKNKRVPELNDDFAKDLGKFETILDVKAEIKKNMKKAAEHEVRNELASQALDILVKKHQFEVPEGFIASELHHMFEMFTKQLQSQGKKFEDSGMSIEQFITQFKPAAADRVRGYLILDAIAKLENISVSESDIEDRISIIAAQANQLVPRVREYYDKNNLYGSLKMQILHEKTLDFVIKKAKMTPKGSS